MTVKKRILGKVLICLLFGSASVAPVAEAQFSQGAARSQPILAFDFEEEEASWTSLDPSAQVLHTTEKANVKVGAGALEYKYNLAPGVVPLLSQSGISISGAKSLRFWAKCSAATVIVVSLKEANGSNYIVPFYLPKDEWFDVALNLTDFVPVDDSHDDNGKLDAEQIDSIGFVDLVCQYAFLAQMGLVKQSRSVYLDDIQVLPTTAPITTGLVKTNAGSYFVIDNFETNVIRWVPLAVKILASKVDFDPAIKIEFGHGASGDARTPIEAGGKGLYVTYKRRPGTIFTIMRGLEHLDLAKATHLSLWFRSTHKGGYAITLKEKDGSEYNYHVAYEHNRNWHKITVPLSDFHLAVVFSEDENEKLDPDQLKELRISDGNNFIVDKTDEVTLSLDAVMFRLGP